jgi:REP element-mobilizing transposase RayT
MTMRKRLHHYSRINTYQFITFRTKDSVDDYLLRLKDKSNCTESQKQLAIDEYLDGSHKGNLLNDKVISLIHDYVKSLEPNYIKLICISIMPNHIHLLIQQNKELKSIMQILKGGLSFKINSKLNRKGALWDSNYFDKVIRSEKHFRLTYNYIKNNAIKARLNDASKRFFGVYD